MRPQCQVDGCDCLAQNVKSSFDPYWRRSTWVREEYNVWPGYVCATHHIEYRARQKGMTGMELRHSKHPYLKYRKDYCENVDARLGFTCTTTIAIPAMLQVDHIDGNSDNNDPTNLQTLCACCHIHKTFTNKDYRTPGRKALKKQKFSIPDEDKKENYYKLLVQKREEKFNIDKPFRPTVYQLMQYMKDADMDKTNKKDWNIMSNTFGKFLSMNYKRYSTERGLKEVKSLVSIVCKAYDDYNG